VDAWINGLHLDDKQRAIDDCNAALNGEREFDTSFRIVRPNGSVLYLKANGSVLRDENGKPQRMIGINRDVTDRKKAEAALIESEERYRNLFQKSHAIMLLIDPETGKIMDVNPSACSYYGWNREELLKMSLHEINTLNAEEIKKELMLAQTEKRNHFIFKHRLADKSIRDVEIYSSPLVVAGKTFLYSIIHDITDRKIAEEALLESEKRIQKKLTNLLSPESDINELSLEDIIDTDAIQSMMEEY
jgi:PAS domain S-box-containing protein